MSRRITSDLINITNGLHHLNGYFSGKKYVYPYGCSRRVIPSSAAPHRYECKYVKQDFYECHTTSLIKHTILARMTNGISSNYVASETKTFTVKWFDTVHFGGMQAPARPIQGYYDTPKPQCPPLDPKPCKPSDKKSPASDPSNCPVHPMARTVTCKPSKKDPCSTPRRKDPCAPKEKKKCGVKANTSFITTEAKFDVSYLTQFLLDPKKYFLETDQSLEILEKKCPTLLGLSAKQDLTNQNFYELSFDPASIRCPSRGYKRRGSSCPPLGTPHRGYYCPPTESCPSQGDGGGGCFCPPWFEGFEEGYECPSRGGVGDGGLYQTLSCAPPRCPTHDPKKGCPPKGSSANKVKPRCPDGSGSGSGSCPPPKKKGCPPPKSKGSSCAPKKAVSCPTPKSSHPCAPPKKSCAPATSSSTCLTSKSFKSKLSLCRSPKKAASCSPPKSQKSGCGPPKNVVKCSPSKDPCGPSNKPPACPSSKKKDPCGGKGSKGGGKGKGFVCPPPKKVPDCPPKGKGKRRSGKGFVCPPPKKIPDCPPKSKGGKGSKGSVCPPPKKVEGCPPPKASGCGPSKTEKKPPACKPRKC